MLQSNLPVHTGTGQLRRSDSWKRRQYTIPPTLSGRFFSKESDSLQAIEKLNHIYKEDFTTYCY
jgi:hypothetical protein